AMNTFWTGSRRANPNSVVAQAVRGNKLSSQRPGPDNSIRRSCATQLLIQLQRKAMKTGRCQSSTAGDKRVCGSAETSEVETILVPTSWLVDSGTGFRLIGS